MKKDNQTDSKQNLDGSAYLQYMTIAITMEDNYCFFLDFLGLLGPSSLFSRFFVALSNLRGLSPSSLKH